MDDIDVQLRRRSGSTPETPKAPWPPNTAGAVPPPPAYQSPPPPPPAMAPVRQPVAFCRGCGQALHSEAAICPSCGVPTPAGQRSHVSQAVLMTQQKSPGIAILLSFLLPGLGQFYAGSAGKGVLFICLSIVNFILMLVIIGFFLQFIVWVWAMIDANMTANTHNTRLLASAA